MHRKIVGQSCRRYQVRVTKMGHAITRMKRYIKPTNISAKDYIQNEIAKANQMLSEERLFQHNDHFVQFHKSNQYNTTETEE